MCRTGTTRGKGNPLADIKGNPNSTANNTNNLCAALILGLRVQHPLVGTPEGLLLAQQVRAPPHNNDRTLVVNNHLRTTTRIDHSPWCPNLDQICITLLRALTNKPPPTNFVKLHTINSHNRGRQRKEGWSLNATMIGLCP